MIKLIRDTWLLFVASLKGTLRNPVWVLLGLFQPVCYILLFAPLLTSLASAPGMGGGGAMNVFVPGLLIMTALFSTAFAGFGLIESLRNGALERLRVTPVSRLAILLGMVVKDVVVLLVQSTILIVLGIALGLRPDPLGLLVLVLIVVLVGLIMSSLSYGLALVLKSEEALASAINFVTLPLLLLSGVMLPMELAPPLLQTLASVNPLAHAVDASRALINGQPDVSVGIAFAFLSLLMATSLVWATRAMRHATS